MDALSRLLSLYPVRSALDTQCRLGEPWLLDRSEEPSGVAPYHLIVEGRAWLEIDGQARVELRAGDMVMLPRGSAHRLGVADEAPPDPLYALPQEGATRRLRNQGHGPQAEVLCGQFHFDAVGARTLIGALPDIVWVRTEDRQEFAGLHALVNLLRHEVGASRQGTDAVIAQLASALFALLMRGWLERASTAPGLFALLADARLSQALHAMLEQPQNPWSLEQLASRCNMSRGTFVRDFRKKAGTTPGGLLLQLRMAQAGQWLQRTRRSVAEIGESVGYQSEAAFNRAFTRYAGMGPGRYRREQASSRALGADPNLIAPLDVPDEMPRSPVH